MESAVREFVDLLFSGNNRSAEGHVGEASTSCSSNMTNGFVAGFGGGGGAGATAAASTTISNSNDGNRRNNSGNHFFKFSLKCTVDA